MNDYSETDKKIFDWYEIAMDILCMAYSMEETDRIKRLAEIYEELLEKVKMLCKESGMYRYINEAFLRTWYFNKNKDRLGMNPETSPLIKGFIEIEKYGYFFTKELNL